MSGYHPGRGHKGPAPETVERIAALTALRDEGLTYAQIGTQLGISRQRVHEILNRDPDGAIYQRPRRNADQRRAYIRRNEAT